MMPFVDPSIHLGDLVVSAVGALLLWMGRRIIRTVRDLLRNVEANSHRLNEQGERLNVYGEVIDEHSAVIRKILPAEQFRRVSRADGD